MNFTRRELLERCAAFGAVTLVLMVLFGWYLYKDLNLRFEIANASRRIADSRVEVAGINQMQRDYIVAANKIELAHTLVRNRLFVYHFTTELGHPGTIKFTADHFDANWTSGVR